MCSNGIATRSTRSSSFFRAVTEYILFGDLNQVHPSQSEVLDYEVRKKLEELEAITNPEMFVQEASFNFPERFSAGYFKLVVNVEDKEELIRCGSSLCGFVLSSRVGSVYKGSGVAWSSQSLMCTSQLSKENTTRQSEVAKCRTD